MSGVADVNLRARATVVRDRFYVGMATAFVAIAVTGFAPTYWIPLLRGRLDVPPIVHVHALFFFGWTLLFLRQTRLAASGEVRKHRELGLAGVSVATAMLFIGLATAIASLKHSVATGDADGGRAFSIVSITGILFFAALVAVAFANVHKPDVHKRLMIVATVSILQAAVGRLFLLAIAPAGPSVRPPVAVTVLPGLVVDLLIVAAMVHDRRTEGRVHPVYWIAGACTLAAQVLRVPLATTGAWMHVAGWFERLLG